MGDSVKKFFEDGEEESRSVPTEEEKDDLEILLKFWSRVQKHKLEFEVFSTALDIAKDKKNFSKADILILAMGEWDLL
jgi:hypothetical protein